MIDILTNNVRRWEEIAKNRSIASYPLDHIPFENYLNPSDLILDYGCGKGRVIEYLEAKHFSHVTGCEPSLYLYENAHDKFDNLVWLKSPRELPFEEASFNAVLLIAVLSSVVPEEEREFLIKRLHRILKKDGKIILADFGTSDDPIYRERYAQATIEPYTFLTQDDIYVHHFHLIEFKKLFDGLFELEFETQVQAKSIHGRALPALCIIGKKI